MLELSQKVSLCYKMLYQALSKALYNQGGNSEPSVKTQVPYRFTYSILVAEDFEVNQKIIEIILESFGCSVVIAKNGSEVVERFKTGSFDLILMDCQMPILDGFEATKQIRALEKDVSNSIPIVALTGNITEEDIQACYKSGMSDFVKKPYSESIILEMIEKWAAPYAEKKGSYLHPNLTDKLYDGIVDIKQYQRIVHLGNDSGFSEKITRIFHESTDERIGCLLQAHDDKNFDEVRKISHMLKASCANMGASKLSSLFKELEHAIAINDLTDVDELVNQLYPTFQKTIHMISDFSGQDNA